MSNIAILDSQNYAIQQAQTKYTGKSVEDNNIHPLMTDNVQPFSTLATQTGMMTNIIHRQSVMTNFDMRPTLSSPPVGQEKSDSGHTAELMKLTTTMEGGDIQKRGRAALASTVFNTQPNPLQTTGSAASINKSVQVSSPSTAPAAHPVHSQAPVETGTDIAGTDAPRNNFVNMIGNSKVTEVNNLLSAVFLNQEARSAKSSAESSERAFRDAERSGNKVIDAEKQRMTGAITAGSMGIVAQGVTTTRNIKALNAESKSISNNLGSAARISSELGVHKSATGASTDAMLHKGQALSQPVEQALGMGNSALEFSAEKSRQLHSQIQLNSHKVRATSEYSNSAIQSSHKIIDGAFNVEAASETKQAELARANQTVNNEVANTHQQTARKTAESRIALNQVLESTLNNNNSTVSSIVDRIR